MPKVNPYTHALAGWCAAQAVCRHRRDVAIAAVGGVLADLDGAGLFIDVATGHWNGPYRWYESLHHVLGHNLLAAGATAVVAAFFARDRLRTGVVFFALFHLHLLMDLAGSGGPDGDLWTISYLYPLSQREFSWSGQWALNAWPNVVFTAALLALFFRQTGRHGFSPFWYVSKRFDEEFVRTVRKWFAGKGGGTCM
ncbi:MAG: metal-dependent hydrolase [Deltaproteobacteria bacterium]|nr:metal-dependent hydrolase [Deltaproteobacteria bacterium]